MNKLKEKIIMWITWRMPKTIVYWCFVRVYAYATTGKYSNDNSASLTCGEAATRWRRQDAKSNN